jgi:hypothetical protein
MYELCMGGGLWFIRCTPEEDPQLILESPWKTAGVVQELWFQIVTGQAW